MLRYRCRWLEIYFRSSVICGRFYTWDFVYWENIEAIVLCWELLAIAFVCWNFRRSSLVPDKEYLISYCFLYFLSSCWLPGFLSTSCFQISMICLNWLNSKLFAPSCSQSNRAPRYCIERASWPARCWLGSYCKSWGPDTASCTSSEALRPFATSEQPIAGIWNPAKCSLTCSSTWPLTFSQWSGSSAWEHLNHLVWYSSSARLGGPACGCCRWLGTEHRCWSSLQEFRLRWARRLLWMEALGTGRWSTSESTLASRWTAPSQTRSSPQNQWSASRLGPKARCCRWDWGL